MRSIFKIVLFISIELLVLNPGVYSIDKGNFLINGSFSYSSHGGSTIKAQNILHTMNLAGRISYFFAEDIAVGGIIANKGSIQGDEYSDISTGIGLTLTYFMHMGESSPSKGTFFAHAGIDVLFVMNSWERYRYKNEDQAVGGALNAGVIYLLIDNVGIDCRMVYQRDWFEDYHYEYVKALAGLTFFLNKAPKSSDKRN